MRLVARMRAIGRRWLVKDKFGKTSKQIKTSSEIEGITGPKKHGWENRRKHKIAKMQYYAYFSDRIKQQKTGKNHICRKIDAGN